MAARPKPQFLNLRRAHLGDRTGERTRQEAREEIAALLQPYFPTIDGDVLVRTIQAYQKLGCWEGEVQISREIFDKTLDVFEFSGDIKQRQDWGSVICAPPDEIYPD